jgi:hypothetical protein
MKLVIGGAVFCFFCVAGCSAFEPHADAGSPKDAATDTAPKEAAACVPDFQGCTPGTSVCCIASSGCNINTGVCQTICAGIGSLCNNNGDCCSGICNGTCE